ncbi:MAG: prepilin-type N-terminal cleavage/methylation domain-containing protein [Sedimentisphaerales bacterium]|nr:prepilin-type N-terminal cleavage/methylation domain-containing protein [Sedimentisphaerales bacterium]
MNSLIRKVSGFTLIELLVVIAIIILLLAILLPVVQRVHNQAKAVVCRSYLKQWGTIFNLYTEESQGCLPYGLNNGLWFLRGPYISPSSSSGNIEPKVFHNFQTRGIACCPMAVRVRKNASYYNQLDKIGPFMGDRDGATFEAWELTEPGPVFRCSYGFNRCLFERFIDPNSSSEIISTTQKNVNVYSLTGINNIPVLLDSPLFYGHVAWDQSPPTLNRYFSGSAFCINRHNGYVNGLFLDWSVRKVGLKELWTLKWHNDYNLAGPWTRAGGVQPEDWPQWMQGFKDY